MAPELKDWIEWKTLCARKLCNKDTANRLGSFAQSRFGIQLRRQISTTNLHNSDAMRQLPSDDDAWHQFESYAALKETRQGKRYKDWIFARVQQTVAAPLDIIQSGATLIMRSVVRSYLRVEYSSRKMISMDQPVGDGNITLGDLLPGTVNPADSAAEKEYNILAEKHSERIFGELSYKERIGLLAKFNGVSLDNSDVIAAAGCRKSTLSQAVRDIFIRLRNNIEQEYRDDGADAIMALSILVIRFLEKEINNWKNSEKSLPECFY